MTSVEAVYARAVAAVPELATLTAAGSPSYDAVVLTDPGWLAERVADAARLWSVPDRRVVGTLWWYSASSVLVAPPVTTLLVAGHAVGLTALRVHLRPDGYLGGGRAGELLDGDAARLGRALRDSFGPIITPLARVSGAGERALWAIAADSLGTWALRAGTAVGTAGRGSALAEAVAAGAGAVLPVPRFVDVPGPAGESRRYLRRASCCLIYVVPDCDKCVSCPRQPPEERLRRLAAHTST